jgi:tetratricopeptide (TPR) repeat protein
LEAAINDYSEAVRIKPTLSDTYLFRGLAYSRKGDRERAVADLKKVLEMSKDPALTEPARKKLAELGIK